MEFYEEEMSYGGRTKRNYYDLKFRTQEDAERYVRENEGKEGFILKAIGRKTYMEDSEEVKEKKRHEVYIDMHSRKGKHRATTDGALAYKRR